MVNGDINPQPIVTVACLVYSPKQEILLLRGKKWKDHYGIPAGKVNFGETLVQAVIRETKEESGLSLINLRPILMQEIINPKEFIAHSHFVSHAFRADTIKSEVVINDESYEYKWINPRLALDEQLNEPTRELINFELRKKASIVIKDLKVDCIVGIFPHERAEEQTLYISATLEVDNGLLACSEELNDTVGYATLSKKISEFVKQKKFQLIETMAEKISELILLDQRVYQVDVFIKKPDAVKEATYMGVQVSRNNYNVVVN
jgi:FolB domain-containing protein